MKVSELIEKLKEMPPESPVVMVWDGAGRSAPDVIWLSRTGGVMLAPFDEPVYHANERPPEAPDEGRWRTPTDPDDIELSDSESRHD